MEFPFTRDELEGLTKDNLFKVASYYQVGVSKGLRKDELVEAIWEGTHRKPKEEEQKEIVDEMIKVGELPEMSVRVRRIYERKLRGEL